MRDAWHLKTTVLPGGRVEISDPTLPSGAKVDVFVAAKRSTAPRSALEILRQAPGHRLFKSREDVEAYLHEERAAWDR